MHLDGSSQSFLNDNRIYTKSLYIFRNRTTRPNTDWSDKVAFVSSPGFSDISLKIPTHLHLWIETRLAVHPVLYVVNVTNPVEAPQVCELGEWKAETRMFGISGASRGLFGSKDDEVEHILADQMKVADVFGVLDESPMVLCGQESFACRTLLDVDYTPRTEVTIAPRTLLTRAQSMSFCWWRFWRIMWKISSKSDSSVRCGVFLLQRQRDP